MSIVEAMFDIGIAIIQLIFGVALALFSITIAINILNRVTKDINEFEELRKKNLAVGIYLAGILVAVGNVVGQAVSGVSKAVVPGAFNLAALLGGLIQLFIGLPLAIVAVTWAQSRVYSWMIKAAAKLPGVQVEKFSIQDELKNGNLAVAVGPFRHIRSHITRHQPGSRVHRRANIIRYKNFNRLEQTHNQQIPIFIYFSSNRRVVAPAILS